MATSNLTLHHRRFEGICWITRAEIQKDITITVNPYPASVENMVSS